MLAAGQAEKAGSKQSGSVIMNTLVRNMSLLNAFSLHSSALAEPGGRVAAGFDSVSPTPPLQQRASRASRASCASASLVLIQGQ